MKTLASGFLVLAVLLVPAFARAQDQTYTNDKQNFTMRLPGPATEEPEDGAFRLHALSPDHTVGVNVYSPDKAVSDIDAFMKGWQESGAFPRESLSCHRDFPWKGNPTGLCDVDWVNPSGVHTISKVWFCVHNGWIYEVGVTVSASDHPNTSATIWSYIETFEFLQ